MYKNKLFLLLKKLDRKEMTRFREFVASPYFNKHKDVIALVQYLDKIYPNFNEKNCDRKKLRPIVFKEKSSTQLQLAIVFTYTKRLLEQFLITEKQQSLEVFKHVFLLQQLRQKEQHKLYDKQLQITQEWLKEQNYKDANFQYNNYKFAKETDLYYEQRREYKGDHSLERKQNFLDRFYLSEKLRDACEVLVRQSTLQVNYSSLLLDVLLEAIEQNWDYYQQIPSIAIYYDIYQMLRKDTTTAYKNALQRASESTPYFSFKEQQSVYQYLQNFCIKQIYKGDQKYVREVFDLTKIQLKSNLLFENDYLPEWHYKNLVTAGLRLGEHTWVKQFIEEYKDTLHPNQKAHAYAFNLATFHYYQKEYDQVLNLLRYLDISDVRYNINAKSMLLCTYYELKEDEALITLSDAFKQYLKRQKTVSADYRKGIENLVKYTRKLTLLRAKLAYESKKKLQSNFDKLSNAILEEENISNKNWLVTKLKELEV